MTARQKVRIQSVDRILDIFKEISSEKNGITISELSKRLELQVSTTYNLVNTLKSRDFVHQDEETKKYFLGVEILSLKNIYVENLDIKEVASPILAELHAEIPETIHLSIRQGVNVVPIAKLDSKYPIRVDSAYVGYKGPIYCTATGRGLLCGFNAEELEALLSKVDLQSYTEHTITDLDLIKKEIMESKRRGYTQDFMEYQQDVYCIGAPVYNHNNEVIASISISIPSMRFTPEQREKVTNGVLGASKEISEKLGRKRTVEI